MGSVVPVLSVRARIELLPERQRLAYAMEVIDALCGPQTDVDALVAWGLTVSEARIVAHLSRRAPGLVSKDALFATLYPCEDGRNPKLVDIYVCKARAKGVRIITHWGHGYSLEAPIDVATLVRRVERNGRWSAEEDSLLSAPGSDMRAVAARLGRARQHG